jgi:hypothetical protein
MSHLNDQKMLAHSRHRHLHCKPTAVDESRKYEWSEALSVYGGRQEDQCLERRALRQGTHGPHMLTIAAFLRSAAHTFSAMRAVCVNTVRGDGAVDSS